MWIKVGDLIWNEKGQLVGRIVAISDEHDFVIEIDKTQGIQIVLSKEVFSKNGLQNYNPKGDNYTFKPDHYSKGIDAWEIIDRSFSPEQKNGFDAGNIIKYVIRHEHKNGLEDLKKARHYLDRMIKRMEEAE